jgi:small-conductance mechanosensitive channel/CRP-like cAMP-binding protein
MPLTPLQSLLGFAYLPFHLHGVVELIVMLVAFPAATALRRRKTVVTSVGFILIGLGMIVDMLSVTVAPTAQMANAFAGAAVVLFFWGIVRLLMDAVAFMARRVRRDFSTILRDLVSLSLYAAIVILVLAADFNVNVYSLVASVGVLGVVIGFAVQQTLGDIFSGLALQLQRPFDSGDWIRSGQFVGRVQGVGVRSTTVVTRHNERLEIPNSAIAKEVLTNYGSPPVGDEVFVGISYNEPPNRVRETVLKVMHDVQHVLTEPEPQVLAWEYGDSAIKYRIKYWIGDYTYQEQARSALITALWYTLRRHAMEIPYPIQTFEMRQPRVSRRPQEEFEREIIGELRQVDFLHNLSEAELRMLVPNAQMHEFGVGETIVREGETGDSMYIIRRGVVEVVGHTPEGKTRVVAQLHRPQVIGEAAPMTGDPRNATCRAQTDVEVLELNREAFAELFKAHPEVVAQIGEVIANRAADRREKLVDEASNGRDARRNRWISKVRRFLDL